VFVAVSYFHPCLIFEGNARHPKVVFTLWHKSLQAGDFLKHRKYFLCIKMHQLRAIIAIVYTNLKELHSKRRPLVRIRNTSLSLQLINGHGPNNLECWFLASLSIQVFCKTLTYWAHS